MLNENSNNRIILLCMDTGLFEMSHMRYEVDRGNDRGGEPSLTEMVEKSIGILKRSPKGFFLAVEGW